MQVVLQEANLCDTFALRRRSASDGRGEGENAPGMARVCGVGENLAWSWALLVKPSRPTHPLAFLYLPTKSWSQLWNNGPCDQVYGHAAWIWVRRKGMSANTSSSSSPPQREVIGCTITLSISGFRIMGEARTFPGLSVIVLSFFWPLRNESYFSSGMSWPQAYRIHSWRAC